MKKLLFMLVLLVFPMQGMSQWDIEMSYCPGSYQYKDIRPSPDLPALQIGPNEAYSQGYVVEDLHVDDFPEPGDVDPALHVTTVASAINSLPGWVRFYGHSSTLGSGFGTWVDDENGNDARDFWAFCYEQAGVPFDWIRYSSSTGYIHCGLYYPGIGGYARLAEGILEWWGCSTKEGDGNFSYSGARIVCLVDHAHWSNSNATDTDDQVTKALKGNHANYDRNYGGSYGAWNAGDNLHIDSVSQDQTTGWPGTYELSHHWHDSTDSDEQMVYAFIDTWCAPPYPASSYLGATGDWTVTEAYFTYDRSGGVNGIWGTVTTTQANANGYILFHEMPSATCADIVWEGAGFSLRRGVGQASEVIGFRVIEEDGMLLGEFETEYEFEVEGYRIEGADSPDDNADWTLVVEIEDHGPGSYQIELPGQRWQWYRLVETETDGNEIIHDLEDVCTRTTITHHEQPSVEFLRQQCDAALDRRGDNPVPLPIQDYPTLVVCPPEWQDDVRQYYTNHEEQINNQSIFVEPLDGWPQTSEEEEQLRQNIKDLASSYYYNEGIQMLWLVGSAIDSTMLYTPWEEAWEPTRLSRINGDYEAPQYKNVYPTGAWVPDAREGPGNNTAQGTPYCYLDDAYAYVDGDSIPDFGVCRLSVHNLTGLLNDAYHHIAGDTGNYGPTGVSMVVGDVNAYGGAEMIENAMAATESTFPGWFTKDHLFQSDYPGGGNRNDAMIERFNGRYDGLMYPGDTPGRKEAHLKVSDDSGRYYPCEVYSVYDGMDLLELDPYSNYFPLGIWLSCHAGCNARHTHPSLGEPMGVRMLTEHYDRGYGKIVAPANGSKATANAGLLPEIWSEISSDWNRYVSIGVWQAKVNLMNHPDYQARDLWLSISSVHDLGNPWYRVNTLRHPVGAPEQAGASPVLLQNFPNPFNPSTKITFTTSKQADVSLTVIDVSGRKVATLVNDRQWQSGMHEVIWQGVNDRGQRVASGEYFYRLDVDGKVSSKKMLLVK